MYKLIRRRTTEAHKDEEGLTIIGVVIAFALLMAVLGPASLLLQSTVSISGNVRTRVVAANLATQQLEILTAQANTSFSAIVNDILTSPSTTVTHPASPPGTVYTLPLTTVYETVNNVPFTLAEQFVWSETGTVTCDPTSDTSAPPLNQVLQAVVTVTWPNMASSASQPMVVHTSIPLPSGVYSPTYGNIFVQLTTTSGAVDGQPYITVTGGSPPVNLTLQTGKDSACAFFVGSLTSPLTANTYTVTVVANSQYTANPSSQTVVVSQGATSFVYFTGKNG